MYSYGYIYKYHRNGDSHDLLSSFTVHLHRQNLSYVLVEQNTVVSTSIPFLFFLSKQSLIQISLLTTINAQFIVTNRCGDVLCIVHIQLQKGDYHEESQEILLESHLQGQTVSWHYRVSGTVQFWSWWWRSMPWSVWWWKKLPHQMQTLKMGHCFKA